MRSAARVGIVGALVAAVVSAGSTVGATTRQARAGPTLGHRPHRGHLRGEPQLRQPLRPLAGRGRAVQEAGNTPRNVQVDTTGKALNCLLQKDVNLTSPPLAGDDVHVAAGRRHRRSRARSPTSRSGSTTSSHRPTRRVRSRRRPSSRPTPTAYSRAAGCRAAAPATWSTSSTRSSTRSTAGRWTATRSGSDAVGLTQGYYDTTQLPIYKYLTGPNAPRYVDPRQLLPGRVRWFLPQPPVAHRGGDAGVPGHTGRHAALDHRRRRVPG